MTSTRRLVLALLATLATAAGAAEPSAAAELDFFEKSVRPILVGRCYKCHSAESEKIKGGLRLDTREAALKGGDTGPALVPGDPDKSLLIKAVRYADPDMEMPPKGKLPQGEIDALVRWVKLGAPDPRTGPAAVVAAKPKVIDLEAGRRHWAYQPIANPKPPAVKDAAWPRNDIDRFVLAKLESRGLLPAPDAAPAVLVRRLYFDLVGLPPTPEQMEAYVNDARPDKYERLVDALLASPHFGERWGRHWLDVARFAESLTLRGFVLKDAWRYRDYVIESFNHDRPFDRFMQEQIAGDLMPVVTPEDRRRQMTATTFLALGNTNLEEQDKKQLEMDIVDEQLDTLGRAFLAQTIGCARCHDHKFDPIPTKDYYALAGILKNTTTVEHANVSKWLDVPLPTDPQRERVVAKFEAEAAALQEKIKAAKAALAKSGAPVKTSAGNTAIASLAGTIVDDAQAKRVGTWKESKYTRGYVGAGYLTDDNDRSVEKSLTYLFEPPASGKYEARFAYTPGTNRATNVQVTVFGADGEKTIVVDETKAPPIDGHFVSLGRHTFEKTGQSFVIVSNQNADGYVIADAVQFLPAGDDAAPASAAAATDVAPAKSNSAAESLQQLESQLKKLNESRPRRDTILSVRESKQIADTRVHIRGNVHTLADPAPRGYLSVLPIPDPPAIPKDQSGRLQLAQWLAHPQNPLPARVFANRLWHHLLGQGLVRTVDNFGTTGEQPSHPDLLDHLATQLSQNNWSEKTLIRQIVLSRTYQQSSSSQSAIRSSQSAIQTDPENRLLSHANRRRLDAESLRDTILSVSGQLDPTPGGPTFPPTLDADFNFKHTDMRRSVYSPVFRNALPDLFEAFDFADPSVGAGRRNTSTVAPQALFMLNHPWIKQQSQAAATRLLADNTLTTNEARLRQAYRLTLSRPPTADEQRVALDFLNSATPQNATDSWSQLFHALIASMDFRYVD